MKKVILALGIALSVGSTTTAFADNCPSYETAMQQIQATFPGTTTEEPAPDPGDYELMKKKVGEIAGTQDGKCGKFIIYRRSFLGVEYGPTWMVFEEVR
jgi:hypothetical protein